MSRIGKVKTTIHTQQAMHDGKSRGRGRKIWKWFGWIVFALTLLLVIGAALVWHNRYSLAEFQVRRKLAAMGVDAQLDISGITKQHANISEISLSKNGKIFFKTKQAQIDYEYPNVLEGLLTRIVLKGVYANITLDGQGHIIDDWLPAKKDGSTGFKIPKDGIEINGGEIVWQAPQARGTAKINAEIKTLTNWNADISSDDLIVVTQGGEEEIHLQLSGAVESLSENFLRLSGEVKTRAIGNDQHGLSALASQFNMSIERRPNTQDIALEGWANTKIEQGHNAGLSLGTGVLKLSNIQAVYDKNQGNFKTLNTNWNMNLGAASISDTEKRARWSQKMTAYKGLSSTPIALHFAPYFTRKFDALLKDFNLAGHGVFTLDRHGYAIGFENPLRITSKAQTVMITQAKYAPVLTYRRGSNAMSLFAHVDWLGIRPLKIKDLQLNAISRNGIALDEVRKLTASIKSTSEWSLKKGGQDFRLAPFSMTFGFDHSKTYHGIVVRGSLDYDGLVPGGAVRGLRASGEIKMSFDGTSTKVGYNSDKTVRIKNFVSGSGWQAKDLSFTVRKTENLYQKHGKNQPVHQPVQMHLNTVSVQIISPLGDKHLHTKIADMAVSADLSQHPINWDIGVGGADIRSDDFPSPGTHILAPTAQMQVLQHESGEITFVATSPKMNVETDNVLAADIKVTLQGKPDDFTAEYTVQAARFKQGELLALPIKGTAKMRAGVLSAKAVTYLSSGLDAPVNINFTSQNGRGRAVVTIEEIIFDPGGLQPHIFAPSLSGKLADVNGRVSAKMDFSFGGGTPVNSSGNISLHDLDFGTLVGPFTGVNANLKFSSMYPLKSEGIQTINLGGFDPGLPLKNGSVDFELIDGGVRIHKAVWPLVSEKPDGVDGALSIEPVDWEFGGGENFVLVNVHDLSLGALIAGLGKKDIFATGLISGQLPVRIHDVNVNIEKGALFVKNGGIIKFKSAYTDAAGEKNVAAGYAFEALKNFEYKKLEAHIDGPLDGDMEINLDFIGSNKDVLYGAKFEFNTSFSGELANIAHNTADAFSVDSKMLDVVNMIDKNLKE
ncbi:MAG: YdbH domain-containing protein [Robiginitomaculum sp.]